MNNKKKEEIKSDTEDLDKSPANSSTINASNISKTIVLEKSYHPTLNELLEDDMEDKFGRPNVEVAKNKDKGEKVTYNRRKADPELAKQAMKEECILRRDGTKYKT